MLFIDVHVIFSYYMLDITEVGALSQSKVYKVYKRTFHLADYQLHIIDNPILYVVMHLVHTESGPFMFAVYTSWP